MAVADPPEVITREADLSEVVRRALAAERVAVDVEANGLFAYRPRACVVQLAWNEGGRIEIALIDTLAVPLSGLSPLLDAPSPLKIFHDLAFDARLFLAEGISIAGVRDTYVAAQLCGYQALGLSALLASELGITIDKRLQQNDWSRRPLGHDERVYLAGDVAYLPELDRLLGEKAVELGIVGEILDDSEHKLRSASRPPRDGRPAYARARGAETLDAAGQAVLRRLYLLRDRAAEARDVPPFTVAPNDVLVEMARRKPTALEALPSSRSLSHERSGIAAREWLQAVEAGLADGDVPPEERRSAGVKPDREAVLRRRLLGDAVASWRRAEAARRGVDEQVVLPGRCVAEWVEVVVAAREGSEGLADTVRSRVALGPTREARYLGALVDLADRMRLAPGG
jgi:ribonuclease D